MPYKPAVKQGLEPYIHIFCVRYHLCILISSIFVFDKFLTLFLHQPEKVLHNAD